MKFIKNISWKELKEIWQKAEKGFWEDFYKKKGFVLWEDWRKTYFKNWFPYNRKWQQFLIEPKEILNFYCGLFKGWREASEEVNSREFSKLQFASVFKENEKIENIKQNFPKTIHLIAFKQGEKIIIVDGSHRALVIAQKITQKDNLQNIRVFLNLAKLAENKKYLFIDYGE